MKIATNLVIKMLVSALLIWGCSQNEVSKKKRGEGDTAQWPIFRGDTRLSGIASEKLTDKMELLWSFKTNDEIKSSPIIGKSTVYVGSNDGFVYALSLNEGNKIWSFDTGDAVEAPALLLDQTIYVGSLNGFFYALDALTGKVKWKYETDGQIYGSANWIMASDEVDKWILVGCYDNLMYSFESTTGRLNWTYQTDSYINGAPACEGPVIVFGGCDEKLHIISGIDGKKIGEVNTGSYIAGSAAILSDKAYLGNYGEKVICIDVKQKKIIWEYRAEEDAAFFSSPAVSEDFVIIGSRDKFLHCIDRESGKKKWQFQARDDIDSSPVISVDKVVVGSVDGRLYVINLADGSEFWSYEIGAGITGSPAIAAGIIIIGAEDGRVYAFGEKL